MEGSSTPLRRYRRLVSNPKIPGTNQKADNCSYQVAIDPTSGTSGEISDTRDLRPTLLHHLGFPSPLSPPVQRVNPEVEIKVPYSIR